MTREEAKEYLIDISYMLDCSDLTFGDGKEMREAIKALDTDTCEDAISRQAVLDTLNNHTYSEEFCLEHHIDWSINLGMAHIAIDSLSSVTPKPNTGHWIEKRYVGNDKCEFECSVCHIIDIHAKSIKVKHVKYCWNCGAKMEVEE